MRQRTCLQLRQEGRREGVEADLGVVIERERVGLDGAGQRVDAGDRQGVNGVTERGAVPPAGRAASCPRTLAASRR